MRHAYKHTHTHGAATRIPSEMCVLLFATASCTCEARLVRMACTRSASNVQKYYGILIVHHARLRWWRCSPVFFFVCAVVVCVSACVRMIAEAQTSCRNQPEQIHIVYVYGDISTMSARARVCDDKQCDVERDDCRRRRRLCALSQRGSNLHCVCLLFFIGSACPSVC